MTLQRYWKKNKWAVVTTVLLGVVCVYILWRWKRRAQRTYIPRTIQRLDVKKAELTGDEAIRLGEVFQFGKLGVEKDLEHASRLYTTAVERGSIDGFRKAALLRYNDFRDPVGAL